MTTHLASRGRRARPGSAPDGAAHRDLLRSRGLSTRNYCPRPIKAIPSCCLHGMLCLTRRPTPGSGIWPQLFGAEGIRNSLPLPATSPALARAVTFTRIKTSREGKANTPNAKKLRLSRRGGSNRLERRQVYPDAGSRLYVAGAEAKVWSAAAVRRNPSSPCPVSGGCRLASGLVEVARRGGRGSRSPRPTGPCRGVDGDGAPVGTPGDRARVRRSAPRRSPAADPRSAVGQSLGSRTVRGRPAHGPCFPGVPHCSSDQGRL